ncbi:MAG TPA: DUF5808 domain-containing protein [Sphingobacteriaceae bacterium]
MKSPFQQFEEDKMITDPANYKWGIFYFNSKDSRAVVPKRSRYMGWTFNFAHPLPYVFILLAVALLWR